MSLPSGYTRLEYIESSGTQYANLGIAPSNTLRVQVDFKLTSLSGASIIGYVQSASAGPSRTCLFQVGGIWYLDFGGESHRLFGGTIVVGQRYHVEFGDMYLKDLSTGNNILSGSAASQFNFAGTISLCGETMCGIGKWYGCRVYNGNTLVRDCTPCKNASGAVGLWDDVGSQFYGNAGTGAFTAGPEVLGSHKVMVGGTIYDVTAGQCMVGGTVYDIQKGLTMIGGTVYEIPLTVPVQGTPVGNLPVGTIVKTPVNGTAKEFIVVHQGLPSSLYDASCSGTWLLMKDCYETRQWHNSDINAYAASTIHSYLNGTFLNLFDAGIKAQIKTVKIPYVNGTGSGGSVASGSSGLSAKIFLLSGYEVGWTTSDIQWFPIDGACLSYFSGTSVTDSKRIAYLNGSATLWWLRSPYTYNASSVWIVYTSGNYNGGNASISLGIRPAFILPFDALVDENMNLLA